MLEINGYTLALDVAVEMNALDANDDAAWSSEEGPYERAGYVVGSNGERFFVGEAAEFNQRGRLEARSIYPHGAHSELYDLESPRATVAFNRGAKALAKAIVSRMLETYRHELKRVNEALARRDIAEIRREGVIASLVNVVDGYRPPHAQTDRRATARFRIPTASVNDLRGGIETDYAGTSVDLKLENVDPALARNILAVCKNYPNNGHASADMINRAIESGRTQSNRYGFSSDI